MSLELLLVRYGERQPVLSQPLPSITGATGFANRHIVLDGYLRDDMRDPQDLSAQGWGVVVPEGPDRDRLLAAIDGLCRARKEQQGREVKVYHVPAGMNAEAVAK